MTSVILKKRRANDPSKGYGICEHIKTNNNNLVTRSLRSSMSSGRSMKNRQKMLESVKWKSRG